MPATALDRTLYHEHVLVRVVSLALLGVALHMVAWSVGYLVLPAASLKGVFLSSRAPVVGGSAGGTLVRILLVNLVLGVGLTASANLFRVGRFPLGYVPALFHWVAFGLFNGTGSFSVSSAPRPPSLWGLLSSRGCWEIFAYSVVAAATVSLFVYRQRSWLNWRTRKERSLSDVTVSRTEWIAIGLSLLLLVAANWTEARSLMSG